MKTIHVFTVLTVLAGVLLAGCGGVPPLKGRQLYGAASYDIAPPVTLSAAGALQGQAPPTLRFASLSLDVCFMGEMGPGFIVKLKQTDGVLHLMSGDWHRGADQISVEHLTGDADFPSGSFAGVFSLRRTHLEGTFTVHTASGQTYALPIVSDLPYDPQY